MMIIMSENDTGYEICVLAQIYMIIVFCVKKLVPDVIKFSCQ